MAYFKCARIPTREMFVSFFREMYDRDPSLVNPTMVSVPYINKTHFTEYDISVNRYGVLSGWPMVIEYTRDGNLYTIGKQQQDETYGEIDLTCDAYLLNLVIQPAFSYNREGRYALIESDTFRTQSTSAHELIYVCRRGGMLIPIRNLTNHQKTLVDLYLFFCFAPYVHERLRRLYADNLLVDYGTASFSPSGSSIFKKVETERAAVKKEEKIATSSRNVFSTKDIIDGSAISTLIEVLEGKN